MRSLLASSLNGREAAQPPDGARSAASSLAALASASVGPAQRAAPRPHGAASAPPTPGRSPCSADQPIPLGGPRTRLHTRRDRERLALSCARGSSVNRST